MENEVAVVPAGEVRFDLTMARAPRQVLAEAQDAAKSLESVISQRKNAVKFNGKQYLAFEDWQTCGKFYGVTAKVISTEYIELDGAKGFLARAEAVSVQTGQVVSAAESMCMNDEQNWAKKPLFQLRSMAQTRACAKSLRNCLAWVVVLAGFEPSVAEEMTGEEQGKPIDPPKPKSQANEPKTAQGEGSDGMVTFVPYAVSKKSGEKNGKAWTKYGIKAPTGEWFGTFDAELGELAEQAKEGKYQITIGYKIDGEYKNVVTLEKAAL